MTDYQISLLNSGWHAVSSLDAKSTNDQKVLGLAQRMKALDADVEAFGQPWASQPPNRA